MRQTRQFMLNSPIFSHRSCLFLNKNAADTCPLELQSDYHFWPTIPLNLFCPKVGWRKNSWRVRWKECATDTGVLNQHLSSKVMVTAPKCLQNNQKRCSFFHNSSQQSKTISASHLCCQLPLFFTHQFCNQLVFVLHIQFTSCIDSLWPFSHSIVRDSVFYWTSIWSPICTLQRFLNSWICCV